MHTFTLTWTTSVIADYIFFSVCSTAIAWKAATLLSGAGSGQSLGAFTTGPAAGRLPPGAPLSPLAVNWENN
jgi:hypothetical protein